MATAPAAPAATFVTSVVGAGTYALLSLSVTGDIAPHWSLGLACGLGGLCADCAGATSAPASSPACRRRRCGCCWGVPALGVGGLYAVQVPR